MRKVVRNTIAMQWELRGNPCMWCVGGTGKIILLTEVTTNKLPRRKGHSESTYR